MNFNYLDTTLIFDVIIIFLIWLTWSKYIKSIEFMFHDSRLSKWEFNKKRRFERANFVFNGLKEFYVCILFNPWVVAELVWVKDIFHQRYQKCHFYGTKCCMNTKTAQTVKLKKYWLIWSTKVVIMFLRFNENLQVKKL